MNTWILLLFLGTATATGFSLVRFVSAGMRIPETVAWSFAAGLVIQSMIEALLLWIHSRPGPGKLLAVEAVVVLGSAFFRRSGRRNTACSAQALRPFAWALAAVAAVSVILFACTSISLGAWPTDFLAIWGLKGRTIFATTAIPARLFHDPALYWAHPEYPLLVPLTFAALSSAMQTWDARTLALFYPVCQAATLCVLWGFLARRASPVAAGAGACLAGYCTGLYGPGNIGTAEIPLALSFVLLAAAATDALDGRNPTPAVRWRLAIAATLAVATKQEGGLFCMLLALCLLALPEYRRRSGTAWRWLAAPVLGHGILLRLARGAVARRDYDLSLLAPSHWGALAERVGVVLKHVATVEMPHAAVALAALAVFFGISRAGVADWLLIPTIAQVTVYAALAALSAFGAQWLLEASFARITLVLFPVISLVIATRLTHGTSSSSPRPEART